MFYSLFYLRGINTTAYVPGLVQRPGRRRHEGTGQARVRWVVRSWRFNQAHLAESRTPCRKSCKLRKGLAVKQIKGVKKKYVK